MSTRLRTVFVFSGAASGGGEARQRLEMWYEKIKGPMPPRRKTREVERLVTMFQAIKGQSTGSALYLFREPRNISFARSRWKQLCKYYSIPTRRLKKVKAVLANARNIRPAPARGTRAGRVPLPPPRNREIRFQNPFLRDRGPRVAPGGNQPEQGRIFGGVAGLGGEAVAAQEHRWPWDRPVQPVPAGPEPVAQQILGDFAQWQVQHAEDPMRVRWDNIAMEPQRGNNDGQW